MISVNNERSTAIKLWLIRVRSQKVKRALLTALADEEMVNIMNCVMHHSKSIKDIISASNNGISHTSAYRKIKWLLDEGLLIVDKIVITSAGKKFSLYHIKY